MPPQPGQEEPLQRMTKLVNSFLARPDSGPFREPVDWRGLELWDYPEVITEMMDLGTVRRKLERQQYATAAQCARDIRLVWQNCMTYNAEGSDFWLLAKAFKKRFEDRFRKIKVECEFMFWWNGKFVSCSKRSNIPFILFCADDVGEEEEEDDTAEDSIEEVEADVTADEKCSTPESAKSNGNVTLDARARFAANLLLLNGPEWGHIVTTLERSNPQALEVLSKGKTTIPGKMEINLDEMDPAVFQQLSSYAAEKAASRKRQEDMTIDDISGKRKRKK